MYRYDWRVYKRMQDSVAINVVWTFGETAVLHLCSSVRLVQECQGTLQVTWHSCNHTSARGGTGSSCACSLGKCICRSVQVASSHPSRQGQGASTHSSSCLTPKMLENKPRAAAQTQSWLPGSVMVLNLVDLTTQAGLLNSTLTVRAGGAVAVTLEKMAESSNWLDF